MKTVKKTLVGAAVAALLGFTASAQASAVIIDLFDDPAVQTVTTTGTGAAGSGASQVGDFPASIIGGYRDLQITKDSGLLATEQATATVQDGFLNVKSGTGNLVTSLVTWDGNDSPTSVDIDGLGGEDLTLGGTLNGFLATIQLADLSFGYSIRVWDMDGDFAELSSAAIEAVTFGTGPQGASFLFDWFNRPAGFYCEGVTCPPDFGFAISRSQGAGAGADNQIDFSDIGALQLEIRSNGQQSINILIADIKAVPEPGALALVGLGLVGAAVAGRRRKQAKA